MSGLLHLWKNWKSRLKNREQYRLSKQEWLLTAIKYVGLSGAVGYLFYHSLYAVLFLWFFFPLFVRSERQRLLNKRKEQLKEELKEFMQSMATLLRAGYALENTLPMIQSDLQRAFPKKSILALECELMEQRRLINQPIDLLFQELSERHELTELKDFTQVLVIARQRGGNLVEIVTETCMQLQENMQAAGEIAVMVAAKVLEQRIMLMIPFGMVAYLNVSNPGYLDCLYKSAFGGLVMTMCLMIILLSYIWAQKILHGTLVE